MTDTTSTAPVDSLATWVDAYRQACAERDRWSDIADRAKLQLTQHLDQIGATVGTLDGRPAVRWSAVTSRRIDTKALKEKDPELAERYTVETSSRRFTVVDGGA
jgi:predicted phage-related endonuclease